MIFAKFGLKVMIFCLFRLKSGFEVISLDFLLKVMIFANFDLKVIIFAYFGFEATISLDFLSRVIIIANFTLKVDLKEQFP